MDPTLPSAKSVSSSKPPLSHRDYTVGWISALPLELTAAHAMLDHVHPTLPQPSQDDNVYTLGAIGKHNVVLACLPYGQMGTNSAAVTATQMSHTFPAIRFGLMVGIGGGCPSEAHDIRLGDVVVSKPGKNDGGVVQFDFGRTVANGQFIRNGALKAPPTVLLNAISVIRATHDSFKYRMIQHLSSFNSKLQNDGYAYQGENNDLLFVPHYEHCEGISSCHYNCDLTRLVMREPRSNPEYPRVHYGTIASGNQVIRHGETRDRMWYETGALCVEMEAAGLMNNFPCLLVRGVCDYADSHKSKRWQAYAAATAAAYTKELLHVVPEANVFVPWSSKIDLSGIFTQDQRDVAISTSTTLTPSSRRIHTTEIDTQNQNDSATHTPTLTYLPFQRNPFFSGRKTILESIERHFRDCKIQQPYILQGMGGLGKTQIALEYAYQSLERRYNIFWVNCTTAESIRSDYNKIRRSINAIRRPAGQDEGDDRVVVLRWLESHDNWLLIFDNAEDPAFPYGNWIPEHKGHPSARQILFTTRDERLATAIVNFKENIPLMNRGESVELFNVSAANTSVGSITSQDAMNALVERLGNLPLAICLAAAYLGENPWVTVDQYLELWQDISHRPKMLSYKRAFSDYNHSIMSTWEISFARVQAVNPRAADTLLVFGFLANEEISFNRLKQISLNIDVDVPEFLQDTTTLQQSVGLLRSLALISFDGNMISLHPLVHEWIQARLETREIGAWGLTTLRVIYHAGVTESFPQEREVQGDAWIEHARFALDAISQLSIPLPQVHEECYFLLLFKLIVEGELTDSSSVFYRGKGLDANLSEIPSRENDTPGNIAETQPARRHGYSRKLASFKSKFLHRKHAIQPANSSLGGTSVLPNSNRASPSIPTSHTTHNPSESIDRGAVKTKPSNAATFDQPPFICKLKATAGSLFRLATRFEQSIRPKYSESTELCARMALNLIGLREWWTEHKRTLPSGHDEVDQHHLIRLKSFLSLCDPIPLGDAARLDDQYPPHILRVLSKYVTWASTNVGVRIEAAMEEHLRPLKVELQQKARQIRQRIESES